MPPAMRREKKTIEKKKEKKEMCYFIWKYFSFPINNNIKIINQSFYTYF